MWRSFECCGKKIIGKPCEGEPHARFDEGKEGKSPLTYSTEFFFCYNNLYTMQQPL